LTQREELARSLEEEKKAHWASVEEQTVETRRVGREYQEVKPNGHSFPTAASTFLCSFFACFLLNDDLMAR